MISPAAAPSEGRQFLEHLLTANVQNRPIVFLLSLSLPFYLSFRRIPFLLTSKKSIIFRKHIEPSSILIHCRIGRTDYSDLDFDLASRRAAASISVDSQFQETTAASSSDRRDPLAYRALPSMSLLLVDRTA